MDHLEHSVVGLERATVSINRRAPINDVTLMVLHTRHVETIEISLRYRTRHTNIAPMTY
jgi:hypothetical protein